MEALKSIARDPRVRQVVADVAVRIAHEVVRAFSDKGTVVRRAS